jgi:hypothetical protein
MEDTQGRLFVFSHIVPNDCNEDVTQINDSSDPLAPYNFKTEVAGLYLSEIQSGPWKIEGSGPVPANRITFTYQGDAASWDEVCGSTPHEPWLITGISTDGNAVRSVEFNYSDGTLTSVVIPTFDSSLGANTSGTTATISWMTDTASFDQKNGTTDLSFNATHLTEILFPTGDLFRFDDDVEPGFLPLDNVTLPSGGRISYERRNRYRVGCANWIGATEGGESPDGYRVVRCGADVSAKAREPGQPPPAGPRCEYTFGVTSRVRSYSDASGSRTEKTWFHQQLSCTAKAGFDENGANISWPYDFSYALRDSRDAPGQVAHPEYLWTLVVSQKGGGDFRSLSPVGEIHRFHPLIREEFSIDHVTGSGVQDLLGYSIPKEFFRERLDEIDDLRVLRHEEIERNVLEGQDDIKDFINRDRYTFIGRRSTYSEENSDSETADIKAENDPCYPDVIPTGEHPNTTCARTDILTSVDQYLNPTSSHIESFLSSVDPEINRGKTWTYDTTNAEDPFVWSLNRQTSSEVFDEANPTAKTKTATTWTNLSDTGTGVQHYYAVHTEVSNPDGDGNCTTDCTEHTYLYDALGNLWKDTLRGGYGTGIGFDSLITTTETLFAHGAPQKKILNSASGATLLLWEREIDPNTGLPRWHVDGAGIGFAYLWDALGRPTDIAPIYGTSSGGAQPKGLWTLHHQKTGDSGDVGVVGAHIDYVPPDAGTLLENRIYDATWSGGLLSGSLAPGTNGVLRAKALFDGLGRMTQETERYPGGARTRFHLRFVHDPNDDFEQCDSNHSWDIPDKSRVALDSEWIDGEDFPGNCASLPWTETQQDALGRTAVQELPDGALTDMVFFGDSTTRTTRTVVTGIDSSGDAVSTALSTIAVSDALGRLRSIDEEVETNLFLTTEYTY